MSELVLKLPDWITREHFPILGLDPGTTTGWARIAIRAPYRQGDNSLWLVELETGRITWPSEAVLLAHQLEDANTVVAEEFLLFAHKAQAQSWQKLPPARTLGFIEGFLQVVGRQPMISVTPAENKEVTNEFLKEKFKTATPRNKHERDALRVITAYWLRKQ